MRFTKDPATLRIKLLESLIDIAHLNIDLTHLELRLNTRLPCRKNGDLTLHEHILTVLLIRADAKGTSEIHIQELVIPRSATSHTMRIQSSLGQILLETHRT
jgi:hypothetical protein